MSTPIQNRYDFVYFFDVTDGNPNGDPDAGNLPRIDPETNQGLVTDVCLKRKIRNFVSETHSEVPGQRIYVREKAVLNSLHNEAYIAADLKPEPKKLPKAPPAGAWSEPCRVAGSLFSIPPHGSTRCGSFGLNPSTIHARNPLLPRCCIYANSFGWYRL